MSDITLKGENGQYLLFDPTLVGNVLGEGGMGRVLRGSKLDTNGGIMRDANGKEVKVAIKILFRESTDRPERIERFRREASVRIKHKNLGEVFDFIEDNGRYHIVTEFLEGETLERRIALLNKNRQTFTISQAKQIMLDLANGLEAFHNKYVHRDVKPSNIMLVPNRGAVLFDYGIVKDKDDYITGLTTEGSFIGTEFYTSPEQINGITDLINKSTDIYSLGIVLFEMLTGHVPFDGDRKLVEDGHLKKKIPLHNKLNKNAYNLIVNATAKDQKYRYKNISQFIDDLQKLPDGKISLIQNEGQTKKIIVAGAISALILIGCLAYFLKSGDGHPKQDNSVPATSVTSPATQSQGAGDSVATVPPSPETANPMEETHTDPVYESNNKNSNDKITDKKHHKRNNSSQKEQSPAESNEPPPSVKTGGEY